MFELFRSMTGFTWTMTRFGAQQLSSLLLADVNRSAAALDAIADSARSQLGGDMDRVLRAGDAWQSGTVDRLFDVAGETADLSLTMLEQSAETLAALPGQRRAGRELANKVRAFGDFQYAEARLGVNASLPLATRLGKALALDPYHRLWAVEGLGFAHAERGWREGRTPHQLLSPGAFSASALIPLHTGMGLSLAMRTLGAIETRDGEDPLFAALERFLALCRANSVPGCETMAIEGLGLVVRTTHPHLLHRVDRLLAAIEPDIVEYYWHGVGRALYFSPSHLFPGLGHRGALEKAHREPPHDSGRRNQLAGFSWALALVNFRHPEVLEGVLRDYADEIFDPPAFANGVSSATLLWYQTNGWEAYLAGLVDHRPDRSTAELWQRLVVEPVENALGSYRTQDQEPGNALEALFCYRPPGGDVATDAQRHGSCCRQALPALSQGLDGWISRGLQSFFQAR